jgi:hypothetical protein
LRNAPIRTRSISPLRVGEAQRDGHRDDRRHVLGAAPALALLPAADEQRLERHPRRAP